MIVVFLSLFTGVAFLYLLSQYIVHVLRLKNYPPGPFPLPFIGNLHQLKDANFLALKEFSKTYGDVVSVSLGHKRVVVVNAIEPAREALVKKAVEYAGRPQDIFTAGKITRGFKDIAFADYGPTWQALRKLAHSSLKLYGAGMEKMEDSIQAEADDLCERIEQLKGKPLDPHKDIGEIIVHFICYQGFRLD